MERVHQCSVCRHLVPNPKPGERFCPAFAEIPLEILDDRFDHRKPFPDDGGIRWEPVNDAVHPDDA